MMQVALQNTLAKQSVEAVLQALGSSRGALSGVSVSAPERFNTGMEKTVFYQNLNALGMNVADACRGVWFDTGVPVSADYIHTQLKRKGRLTAGYAAMFALFFKEQKKRRKRHVLAG